jgi:excisionase family DNA binding protein
MGPATISVEEAARLFGVSRGVAYDAARRGQLPVTVLRIGRRLVIPRSEMARVLGPDFATSVDSGDEAQV